MKAQLMVILMTAWIVTALDNGAALRPPLLVTTQKMGCAVNQGSIKAEIDQLVASGLAGIGFRTILIHDCWQGSRDTSSGKIAEDINRFPNGLKNLITYAHERQFAVGLGTDIGTTTISGRPGSKGYQKVDALTYASWNVDMVFLANSKGQADYRQRFIIFSEYLQETGSKVISIDLQDNNGGWAKKIANSWTTTKVKVINWETLSMALIQQFGANAFAESGAWNDPGSIDPALDSKLFQAQVGVWIGIKAPIKIQAPISSIEKSKLTYLLNEQVLAINQDLLKRQPRLVHHDELQKGFEQVWGGQLSGDRYVLIFLNGQSKTSKMTISLVEQQILRHIESYSIRDPILHQNLGSSSSQQMSVNVPAYSVAIRILHF